MKVHILVVILYPLLFVAEALVAIFNHSLIWQMVVLAIYTFLAGFYFILFVGKGWIKLVG